MIAPMNYRRGLNRLFVISTICWYVAAGFMLGPKWYSAWNAHRYAEHIRTNSRNADGTYTLFTDEIATGPERQPKPSDATFTMTPMRFLAWDTAERQSKTLRPIKQTVLYGVLPIGVYFMALAIGWIVRGFGAKSPGTQI